jgi:uncharacterized protein with PIN domain
MAGSYSRQERHELADALKHGAPLRCPVCGSPLAEREVTPKRELSYVRRRVWLICTGCRRSAVVDVG